MVYAASDWGVGQVMPFIKIDVEEEQKEFEELLKNPEAKGAYDKFENEYTFRKGIAMNNEIKEALTKQGADTIHFIDISTFNDFDKSI